MPLMVSENGRQQRIVPARSVVAYEVRGWTVAGDTPTGEAPAVSDRKAVWESYAQAQGIDTDGMTKDDIITAVEGS